MNVSLLVQIIVVQVIIFGVVLFFLRKILLSSTQSAVNRLNNETEQVRAKQAELNQKIKEAEEELAKRRKEADDLAKKMIEESENKAKQEYDKHIKKARLDGEEIITKAQNSKDKMRREIEKEVELKMIDFSVDILSAVLSQKGQGALNNALITELLDALEKVDMGQVDKDIDTVSITTAIEVGAEIKNRIIKIIKEKLGREIKVNASIDPKIVGGVIFRFGSLALDGSFQSTLKETATGLKQKIEGDN